VRADTARCPGSSPARITEKEGGFAVTVKISAKAAKKFERR
jgi:hypothetical protein